MLLFFIRHGDPIYDPDCLTPLGRRQAEAIARRLSRYGLDQIYMSSSGRAMQTALPTCEMLKKEAVILDWANEKYAWENMSLQYPDGGRTWAFFDKEYKDVLTSKEIRALGDHWDEHPFFAGGTFAKRHRLIEQQTRDFMKELGFEWCEEKGQYRNLNFDSSFRPDATHRGKRVALFAHHGFGTNFLSRVLDIPYPQVCLKMNFGHTGMTVIEFPETEEYVIPQMLTMGNDGHLLADNLPTMYNNDIYF